MLIFKIFRDRMEQLSSNKYIEIYCINFTWTTIKFFKTMLNMLTLCSYSQANYFSKSVAGGSPLDTIIQATLLYTSIYTVE
jgi:hypothetical protein